MSCTAGKRLTWRLIPPLPAAMKTYEYTHPTTGDEYLLSTIPATWFDAQTDCNSKGGHLAAYTT